MKVYFIVISVTSLCGCVAQSLIQPELSITKSPTKTIRVTCKVEAQLSNAHIHWYRQIPGEALKRILYIQAATDPKVEEEFRERFSAVNIPADNACNLVITSIKQTDTGTYYCAYWEYGAEKVFGTGTKLIVSEEEAKKPRIRLFPPNGQELKETSEATVVCLLTGFFPEVIKVYWEIAGHRQEDEKVGTDSVEKEEGETYSVISRLKISKLQWEEDKITCGAEHETAPEATTIDKNSKTAPETAGPTCPPSETVSSELSEETDEGPPLSSLQVASFTYTLLLMKNVVYCGIISFILYRAEYHHPKKPL